MKCFYCERQATCLCDFVFNYAVKLVEPLREGDDGAEIVRKLGRVADLSVDGCDRPLCDVHAVRIGTFFASGEAGFIDSIDRCPGHADMPDCPDRTARCGGGNAA